MTDRERYIIKVQGKLVEVTPDVYYAYFRMERQERGQEEKKQRNDVVSYDALDEEETSGMEAMPDLISPSMEELAIASDLHARLHRAVKLLPRAERELIEAIYFHEKSTADYAEAHGLTVRGVNKRRQKILSKLKSILNVLGSF